MSAPCNLFAIRTTQVLSNCNVIAKFHSLCWCPMMVRVHYQRAGRSGRMQMAELIMSTTMLEPHSGRDPPGKSQGFFVMYSTVQYCEFFVRVHTKYPASPCCHYVLFFFIEDISCLGHCGQDLRDHPYIQTIWGG